MDNQNLRQRDRLFLADALESWLALLAREQQCLPSEAVVTAGEVVDFAGAMRSDYDGDHVDLAAAAAQTASELDVEASPPSDESIGLDLTTIGPQPWLPVEPGTNRRHSWTQFREAGMLWTINRVLHMFGWCVVVSTDDETGETLGAFPVRTAWRGFDSNAEARGYARVSAWMKVAAESISDETE